MDSDDLAGDLIFDHAFDDAKSKSRTWHGSDARVLHSWLLRSEKAQGKHLFIKSCGLDLLTLNEDLFNVCRIFFQRGGFADIDLWDFIDKSLE